SRQQEVEVGVMVIIRVGRMRNTSERNMQAAVTVAAAEPRHGKPSWRPLVCAEEGTLASGVDDAPRGEDASANSAEAALAGRYGRRRRALAAWYALSSLSPLLIADGRTLVSPHEVYLAPLASVKKEIFRGKTRAKEPPERNAHITAAPVVLELRERAPGTRNDAQSPTKHGVLASLDRQSGHTSSSTTQSLAQGNMRSSNQHGSDLAAHRQDLQQIPPTSGNGKLAVSEDQLCRLKQKVRLLPITDDDRHAFWDSMRAYKKLQRHYLESLLRSHSSPMGFNIEAAWSKTLYEERHREWAEAHEYRLIHNKERKVVEDEAFERKIFESTSADEGVARDARAAPARGAERVTNRHIVRVLAKDACGSAGALELPASTDPTARNRAILAETALVTLHERLRRTGVDQLAAEERRGKVGGVQGLSGHSDVPEASEKAAADVAGEDCEERGALQNLATTVDRGRDCSRGCCSRVARAQTDEGTHAIQCHCLLGRLEGSRDVLTSRAKVPAQKDKKRGGDKKNSINDDTVSWLTFVGDEARDGVIREYLLLVLPCKAHDHASDAPRRRCTNSWISFRSLSRLCVVSSRTELAATLKSLLRTTHCSGACTPFSCSILEPLTAFRWLCHSTFVRRNDARAYLELLDADDVERRQQLALLLDKRRLLREATPLHPADDPAHRIRIPPLPKRREKDAVAKVEDNIADQELAAEDTVRARPPGCADVVNPTGGGELQVNATGGRGSSEFALLKDASIRVADEHGRGAQADDQLSMPQVVQRSKDEAPQLSIGADTPKRSYGLVVVSCSFRHLPNLSEKTKEVAVALFNALMDPSFGRFASRGSRLLLNPSVIEFQDTMKELQGICERDSAFFLCLSVRGKEIAALDTPPVLSSCCFVCLCVCVSNVLQSHGARVRGGANEGSFVLFNETRLSSEAELLLTAVHESELAQLIHAIPSRHKLVALELCHLRESKEPPSEVAASIRTRIRDQFAQRLQHSMEKLQQVNAGQLGEAAQATRQSSRTVILEASSAKSEISLSCAEDEVSNFLHRLNDAFRGGAITQALDQEQDRRPLYALEVAAYVRDSVRMDAEKHNALVKQEYSKQVRTKYERVAEFQEIAQTPLILLAPGDGGSDFALGAIPAMAPTTPFMIASTLNSISIGWSYPRGETSAEFPVILGYHVEYRGSGRASSDSGVWKRASSFQVLSFEEVARRKQSPPTSVTAFGLASDTGYCYRVRARSAGGWGPFSGISTELRTQSCASTHDQFSTVQSAVQAGGVRAVLALMQRRSEVRVVQQLCVEELAKIALQQRAFTLRKWKWWECRLDRAFMCSVRLADPPDPPLQSARTQLLPALDLPVVSQVGLEEAHSREQRPRRRVDTAERLDALRIDRLWDALDCAVGGRAPARPAASSSPRPQPGRSGHVHSGTISDSESAPARALARAGDLPPSGGPSDRAAVLLQHADRRSVVVEADIPFLLLLGELVPLLDDLLVQPLLLLPPPRALLLFADQVTVIVVVVVQRRGRALALLLERGSIRLLALGLVSRDLHELLLALLLARLVLELDVLRAHVRLVEAHAHVAQLVDLGQLEQRKAPRRGAEVELLEAEDELALVLLVRPHERDERLCAFLEHVAVAQHERLDAREHVLDRVERQRELLARHLADPEKVHVRVLVRRQERDRRAAPAGARGAADAMHEKVGVLRRVVLDDPVDVRQVDAARHDVRAHEQPGRERHEAVVVGRALLLRHLAVQRHDWQGRARGLGEQVLDHAAEKVDGRARREEHDELLVLFGLQEVQQRRQPLLVAHDRVVIAQRRRDHLRVVRHLHGDRGRVAQPCARQRLHLLRLRGREEARAALLGQVRQDLVDAHLEAH
ncbi:hypothetical protein PybrP1_000530, partial [[Pythium] brassicae (nom. inval.)]